MQEEQLTARGHEHVRATHASTLEITTDDWLTPAGDCIVGIEANRAPADFAPAFVERAQSSDATIELQLSVDTTTATVVGRGDPELTYDSERCLIARTSTYVDDRTVMLEADRAAADLDRTLIERLAEGASLDVTLTVR